MTDALSGTVVVGVGADGAGDLAALSAARIANQFASPLVIVCGYEPSALGGPRGVLREEIEAVAEEAVGAVRDAVLAQYPNLDVRVEYVPDRPVESLVRVADDVDALVIVVGHGGRGPLSGAMLGGVTYGSVHQATRPVLVVPGSDAADN